MRRGATLSSTSPPATDRPLVIDASSKSGGQPGFAFRRGSGGFEGRRPYHAGKTGLLWGRPATTGLIFDQARRPTRSLTRPTSCCEAGSMRVAAEEGRCIRSVPPGTAGPSPRRWCPRPGPRAPSLRSARCQAGPEQGMTHRKPENDCRIELPPSAEALRGWWRLSAQPLHQPLEAHGGAGPPAAAMAARPGCPARRARERAASG